MLKRHFSLFSYLIIFICGFLIYSSSLNGDFLFDDGVHIAKQSFITDLSNFTDLSYWQDVDQRPLAVYSFALNYHFFGFSEIGFHIVNVIIHILSAIIIYLFVSSILVRFKSNVIDEDLKPAFALFVALIFLIHPLQTQSVSYIVQRMTSMSGMFYLLACYSFLKFRLWFYTKYDSKTLLFLIIFVLSAIAAILSKQNTASLPIALIFIEFFFVRDRLGWINRRLVFSLLISILSFFTIFAIVYGLPAETDEITHLQYFYTQLKVIPKYFMLFILPISQNIDHDIATSLKLSLTEILGFLFLISILIVGIKIRHRKPLAAFGIFWIFICLSVESSVIPITDVMFEHRMYLPLFGIALVLGDVLISLLKNRKILTVLALLLLICFGTLSHARNFVWQNAESLWTDAVEKSPDKARPHLKLGVSHFMEGEINNAIILFERATQLDSTDNEAWFNLGECYQLLDSTNKAFYAYDQAMLKDPRFALPYVGRAAIFRELGSYELALNDLTEAIKRDNKQVDFYLYRADLYLFLENYQFAYRDFTEAQTLSPRSIEIYHQLARLFIKMREFKMALDYLNEATSLDPINVLNYRLKGICYAEQGLFDDAMKNFDLAIELGDIESKNLKSRISPQEE